MKPFTAPCTVDECKARLTALNSSSLYGFMQIKVRFIPNGGEDYRYVLSKTLLSKVGPETTLVVENGSLTSQKLQSTSVTGVSYVGRLYRLWFIVCALLVLFSVVRYFSSQEPSYLFAAVLIATLIGLSWLMSYYWRHQLEGMIEQVLKE